MLIGFDASRAFVSEATGTENYSLNLLKALAKVDRKNWYRVYLREAKTGPVSRFPPASARSRGDSKVNLNSLGSLRAVRIPSTTATRISGWPSNFDFRLIRPSRLWTQVGLALETWRAPVDLLFVPAHTLPILRKPTVKTVVTIHDLGVEYLPGYHQFPQRYYLDFASRYAAKHADAIIAVSAATKRDLINKYRIDGKKIFVVHEGVDRTFFRPKSKKEIKSVKLKFKIDGDYSKKSSAYILFVGTIQPRKNLEMLIKAFSLLVSSGEMAVGRKKELQTTNYKLQTLQLIIAGKLGWDYKEILAALKKYGVEDRVRFIGRVDDADLPALYSGASVFAFPSLFEGFGLPILEALACGCRVVASDIPPHREILRKFSLRTTDYRLQTIPEAITLVKPNDTERWVDVLYQYISQYETRSTFSNINFNLEANFSWNEAARNTLALFNSL